MKKILFILFVLTASVSFGQGVRLKTGIAGFSVAHFVGVPPGYTKLNVRYEFVAMLVDSGLHVPQYNGVPSGVRTGVWVGDGAVAVDTLNGYFYWYSGGAWIKGAKYSDIPAAYTAGDGLLLTGSEFKVLTKRSITIDNDSLMLVNDTTATPADHYYGFNSAGRRGYYPNSSLVGINLYNSNGTLTGDRTVGTSDKTLTISSGSSYDQLGLGETNPYWQQFITKNSRYIQLDATTDGANVSEFLISSRGPTSSNISTYSFDQDGFFGQMTAPGGVYSSFQFDPDSLFMQPWLGQLNIDSLRTWTAVGDTTYKKPMTWDTRNGRWEYASNWFGGGGTTYTFTNGLTESGGTVKLGGTLTDPTTIDADGNNLTISGAAQLELYAQNGGNVDIGGAGKSQILIGDNILINPYLAGLAIDSLNYTLSTTGKKIMLRDTATGLVQNIDPALLTVSGVTAGSQGQIYQTSNGAAAWKYDTTTLVTFTAGANFAADTAAFTDSTIYGSFKLMGNDTFYVTGVSAVLYSNNAITDTLGIQITYNDTINVIGSHVFAATYAVNNETTGQDADGDDFTGSNSVPIPPGNWVWLKSPTVVAGRKPYHLSVSIIGYKKRVN